MPEEQHTNPEETFGFAGKAKEPEARPKTAVKRKTTSRRTKTVLDEIAEEESKLRWETRRIEREPPVEKSDAPKPVAQQLDEEYQTLQEKILALDKLAAEEQAATEPASAKPSAPQNAVVVQDFLKEKFFAMLAEGEPSDLPGDSLPAAPPPEEIPAVAPEAFEETAPPDALKAEPREAESSPAPIVEQAVATPNIAEEPSENAAMEQATEATGAPAAAADTATSPGEATLSNDIADATAQEPAKDGSHRLGKMPGKVVPREMRALLWQVFGYFCVGLSALVIVIWISQLMSK